MAATLELMDRGLMKRLLVKSKQEPVACAVATAADGKGGLLLLDKIKQGKALERELVKSEPDAKNPRFGTAFVDTDQDPKLVKFMLNKPAAGLARRLVKTLKGTGFSKVEICGEDGTVLESAGGEEGDEETGASGPGTSETAAIEPAAPEPAHAAADADKVQHLIRGLLPQVQKFAGDPAIRNELIANLQKANALLKANEPDEALATVRLVVKALADAGSNASEQLHEKPQTAPAIKLSPVKLGKASLLWRGMWAKSDKDLRVLSDKVLDFMMHDLQVDPDDYAEIESNLGQVGKVTERLNLALADELDELRNAVPERAAAPLQTLERRLADYEKYLQTDEWASIIDDNEFHPVTVQADMLKAVRVIREALKPEA